MSEQEPETASPGEPAEGPTFTEQPERLPELLVDPRLDSSISKEGKPPGYETKGDPA